MDASKLQSARGAVAGMVNQMKSVAAIAKASGDTCSASSCGNTANALWQMAAEFEKHAAELELIGKSLEDASLAVA